ncbi:MAG: A/G-specific adenine glycosylase [Planctomycetota bacterium]
MGTDPRAAARELIAWYRAHARALPWRQTRDPYAILVSEVMLQQTQVDRVLPYYRRWLQAYPDAAHLACGQLPRIHRLWKGLGYPSRAERLRATCREIVQQRDGVWPTIPAALQELPGIGPYTAAAVACFAFGAAVPLVDTNVARVYCRRDGLPGERRRLWEHAAVLVDPDEPIAYNNALMELGATICTAREPRCTLCPWFARCRLSGEPERLVQTANPLRVASARTRYGVAITDRRKPRVHVAMALIHDNAGKYLVARRQDGVAYAGYWELVGGKRERGESDREALAREIDEEIGCELLSARPFVSWHHDAGDHYCSYHCFRCRLFAPHRARPLVAQELRWVSPEEFLALSFPPPNAPVCARFAAYHRLRDPRRAR